MSDSETQKIKIIDFRNARYQGKVDRMDLFTSIGILLDDQYLFCLGKWTSGQLDGPSYIIYPNQQIFYGEFCDGVPNGLCCFDTTDACRVFCNFKDGKIKGNVVSMFEGISYIVEMEVSEHGKIDIVQQINYGVSPENRVQYAIIEHESKKWDIAESILQQSIPSDMKILSKFLKNRILNRYPELDSLLGFNNQSYVGFQQQGLGVKFQLDNKIRVIGYFDKNKILSLMGKKMINRTKNVREQGLYHIPETLTRYQDISKRPLQAKKHLRNFYRQSFEFRNRFIKLAVLEELKELFNKIKWNIKQNTIERIAQQILQNPIPIQYSQNLQLLLKEQDQRSELRKTPPKKDSSKSINNNNSEINIQKLKEQLNRSLSKKNYRNVDKQYSREQNALKSKSPYKQYDSRPAQLNYTSKKRQNPQQKVNNYSSRQYKQYQKNDISNELSKIKIETSSFSIIDQSRKNGKIKQNNKSRTPTKTHLPKNKFLYNYLDQSKQQKRATEKVYANIELDQPHPLRTRSPIKNTSPYKNNSSKLNNMADMYDQYQYKEQRLKAYQKLQKNNSPSKNITMYSQQLPDKNQYSRNHARKYHYRDHDDYKNSHQLTGYQYKASKKHEVPQRSVSPYTKQKPHGYVENLDRTSSYHHYKNRNQ